jgi:hypothetical protein
MLDFWLTKLYFQTPIFLFSCKAGADSEIVCSTGSSINSTDKITIESERNSSHNSCILT